MLNLIKKIAVNVLSPYSQLMNKREFKHQPYNFNERPIEFEFVFRQIARLYPEKVLDVGTGTTALPHLMRNCGLLVTAIDNIKEYWPAGMYNRHYYVIDDDITDTHLTETYDLITCISVLEHIKNFDAAIQNMFELLKAGGHLILTMPYTEDEYVADVYALPQSNANKKASYITQSFSRNELNKWMENHSGEIIEQEYYQCWSGGVWTVGDKIIPPKKVSRSEKHQLSCILIQKKC